MSSTPLALSPSASLYIGDALSILPVLPGASVDAVVTDPPYAIRRLPKAVLEQRAERAENCRDESCSTGAVCQPCARLDLASKYADAPMLGQQSQNWHESETHSRGYADNDPQQFGAWCGLWLAECLRVLKPGGHLVAFGGTRTWHRLATAAEDAGFEIRDSLAWLYSSGMPKSQDVARALHKSAGPAAVPSDVGTEVAQWTGWGTTLKPAFEPIVLGRKPLDGTMASNVRSWGVGPLNIDSARLLAEGAAASKWPSNVHLDGALASQLEIANGQHPARFFWVSKPSKTERVVVDGVAHPTVKPLDLMRRLIRLVTPPGGTVLDPFAGSGTTVEAGLLDGFRVIGVERETTYVPLIESRIRRSRAKTHYTDIPADPDTLF